MNIDLTYEEKYYQIVKDIVLAAVAKKHCKVFLFGSRATETFRWGSDFDISIEGLPPAEYLYIKQNILEQIKELQKAINNFSDSLSIDYQQYDSITQDAIKSGQVKKFEFCVELYWKTLKRYILSNHGFDPNSPKATIKKGLELALYDYQSYETAIKMINWRNELSHVYKEEKFESIRNLIISHHTVWKALLAPLT